MYVNEKLLNGFLGIVLHIKRKYEFATCTHLNSLTISYPCLGIDRRDTSKTDASHSPKLNVQHNSIFLLFFYWIQLTLSSGRTLVLISACLPRMVQTRPTHLATCFESRGQVWSSPNLSNRLLITQRCDICDLFTHIHRTFGKVSPDSRCMVNGGQDKWSGVASNSNRAPNMSVWGVSDKVRRAHKQSSAHIVYTNIFHIHIVCISAMSASDLSVCLWLRR